MNPNPINPLPPLEVETRRVEANVRKINALVHWLLIIGLAAAALMMVTGIVLGLLIHRAMPNAMVPLADLTAQLALFNPAAFLSLGLLLLIATPILRVTGSIIGFVLERDWRYALVTLVVLVIVLLSIYLGQA
jgi:uncharacterized membrane protein